MQGYSYKTTAIALQNRRLVSVSKKGGVWRAVATEAGSYYLEHGSYLELAPNSRRPPIAAARSGQASQQRTDGPGKRPQLVRRTKSLSPTEKLIADLVAHGQVSVSGPYRAKYEARVAAALRFGKVPEGKVMVTEGTRWSREYVIRLQDAPEWLTTALAPVPVPTTLRGAHPAVKALDVEKLLVGLDRSVKHRALLLIQALAAEAQRRGYDVQATKVTTDAYGYQRRETKDQLTISAGQHSVGIRLYQLNNRTRHEPTPAEEAKAASDRWYRIPKFDVSPSERLSIELNRPGFPGGSKPWKGWSHGTTAPRIEAVPA